jgi:hypothetical protein
MKHANCSKKKCSMIAEIIPEIMHIEMKILTEKRC